MDNTATTRHRILVIGGGNGGLSIAGRLRRGGISDVAVIEPRDQHVFAPLQSHIAGGIARASEAVRPQGDVTPKGVRWIRDRATHVDPHAHAVTLSSGDVVTYEHLIITAGLETRYDGVPGLDAAMNRPSGVSSYTFELAQKASPALRDVRGGTVVFVQQPEPASAAGVAQKPMYLACDWWRSQGRLDGIRVVFVSPEPSAFSVPAISDELQRKLDEYGIETHFSSDVREVRDGSITIGRGDRSETIEYDLLHAAPPQAPPAWIADSGLADDDGFVDVDPRTLRSRTFDGVWALGDAASVDTLRSGGAIRMQAKALARNLRAVLDGQEPRRHYDGYTVCPITVSRRTVVFAEFDGHGRLAPSIPGFASLYRESRISYVFDRHILPWVYWHLIVQGRA
ncbi:NAD(P)/FAD-dependent oxidoreductase [Microbacterium sp. SLBN-146]|uniref:NAD(P)/FAD-dependent oxidoreductase n=1 Tax=Microbacterium sp. SLBN-146 TaxID=2768457 RepID=UPI0011523A1E|nr:FAD-dependent oxidoreductase [Microbacterium sp. SLBN-146]